MQRRIFLTCTLLAFLTACIAATATSSPLPTLTPVWPDKTQPMALLLEAATSSPTPEIVSPTPEKPSTPATTLTPEPTNPSTLPPLPTLNLPPTLAATSIPQPAVGSGAIQFFGPGPLSKLVSPVTVYGYAIPGYGNKGRVSLYGEDGRLLASEVLQLNTAYTWAYFYWTLPFEIQAAGELARLTMSTQDQYGRLTAVYSVHLILLSEGFSIINPPGDLKERCVIEQPAPGRRIAGGILAVAGEMRPFNRLPLVVELVARDGNVIASQLVAISPAPDDSYVPFHVDLSYSISTGDWARLVVRQPDERIGGTMYLYSREVFLNP
ncbi:MAG: hypothetical protein IMZ50_15005 [Candidatus Atribacteria bacterium]|nr:hypothetical protein [Candidatus Atribacteria bacterium]